MAPERHAEPRPERDARRTDRATRSTHPHTITITAEHHDGSTTTLLNTRNTCIHPHHNTHATHVPHHLISSTRHYHLRITTDHATINRTITPTTITSAPIPIVLIPLTINGVTHDLTPQQERDWIQHAHALYPIDPTITRLAPHAVQRLTPADHVNELHALEQRLTQANLIPPNAILIGIGATSGAARTGLAIINTRERFLFIHELGHAFGLPHAPGCGAFVGPITDSRAIVDPLGYNHITRTWLGGHDYMTYCRDHTNWLGAWAQARITTRLQHLTATPE